ncbi:hypothetical protein AAMO2058_001501700 [Amorphochlora amoebiformis]
MSVIEWQGRFNELAAKYKASQSDLKRYTRVAQEHGSRNQQLQEAYLKLKMEVEKQQVSVTELNRLKKKQIEDKKLNEEKFRALAEEFKRVRTEDQDKFSDNIQKMRAAAEHEMERSGMVQENSSKEIAGLKEVRRTQKTCFITTWEGLQQD